jgi:hypothetical protein
VHPVEHFFLDLDQNWPGPAAESRLSLLVLGSTALFLQCDYLRGTKDSDVIETLELRGENRRQLETLAGRGSLLQKRHRMYLDVVARVIPFLPAEPLWYPMEELTSKLRHFSVLVLDPVDVVVSKLARFHANDRDDIREMIRRDMVSHAEVLARFQDALTAFQMDARASDFPTYLGNLHRVERDYFGKIASEVELPESSG